MNIAIVIVLAVGITLLAGVPYASFFEWFLHKYIMHKNLKWFSYPFKKHACVHHQIFKADETYHLIDEKDRSTIPMAWWNGPVLILIGTLIVMIPIGILVWIFHVKFIPQYAAWTIAGTVALICAVYYGAYEYLHWCMHEPRNRWFERTKVYQWLDRHHRYHHDHMNRNLNVVLPLMDWLARTLVIPNKDYLFGVHAH